MVGSEDGMNPGAVDAGFSVDEMISRVEASPGVGITSYVIVLTTESGKYKKNCLRHHINKLASSFHFGPHHLWILP